MKTNLYPPSLQAVGEFDGGKITEQKPVGFPGEGSAVVRIGPLFYWAWAFADQEGFIPPHPHQAFEIMTYVVQGEAHHGDSLGTNSIVGPGGAQLIQAGSGVHHNERFVGPNAEAFQIWFEPFIREALQRPPAYNQYLHDEFPIEIKEGATVKTVIGSQSPISIVADAGVWDIELTPGSNYEHPLGSDRAIAALAVRGSGTFRSDESPAAAIAHREFLVVNAEADEQATIQFEAGADESLRLLLIEVPTKVDYPLYPKRS